MGNYERYYGYRDLEPRFSLLRDEWFRDKKCKDIGCHSGQFTLEIARRFAPLTLVGVDTDGGLIKQGRDAVRRLASKGSVKRRRAGGKQGREDTDGKQRRVPQPGEADKKAQSDDIQGRDAVRGEDTDDKRRCVAQPGETDEQGTDAVRRLGSDEEVSVKRRRVSQPDETDAVKQDQAVEQDNEEQRPDEQGLIKYLPFPRNVVFAQESGLESSDHSFDTITAFSVTKWIHLEHGDEGLLRMFHTVFDSLKPGGLFIVEPQQWTSYKKAQTKRKWNLGALQRRPDEFPDLLRDIGFVVTYLGIPEGDIPKGFKRPLYLCTKPEK